MSYERFEALVEELCLDLEVPDIDGVFHRGMVEYRGFDVLLSHSESDPSAMYTGFDFGTVPAGRSLRIFRLMLEANLAVYAQDQAVLGMDIERGAAQLTVRTPMSSDLTGAWLRQTLDHYVEHGVYWRQTLIGSSDEMFASLCAGDYQWIRA